MICRRYAMGRGNLKSCDRGTRSCVAAAEFRRHFVDKLNIMRAVPWFVETELIVKILVAQIRQHIDTPAQKRVAIRIYTRIRVVSSLPGKAQPFVAS